MLAASQPVSVVRYNLLQIGHIRRKAMVHTRIEINPEIMFGKPVIRGTRITVELILRKLAGGMIVDQIVADHPHLNPEDVYAAAAFAADHLAQEEIIFASGQHL
jgi:uncharacterized protein (DUF433 family)